MYRIFVILVSIFLLSVGGGAFEAKAAVVGSEFVQPPKKSEPQKSGPSVKKSPVRKKAPAKLRLGLRVPVLPRTNIHFVFDGRPHYFNDGVVYIKVGNQYEVVEYSEGMMIPNLPREGLRKVTLNDKVYYESYDVVYQAIETRDGIQYQVVGWIE